MRLCNRPYIYSVTLPTDFNFLPCFNQIYEFMKNNSFIEWPELNFDELKDYYVENKPARIMYRGVLAVLLIPEIVIRAFYEILRFKM